jgi:hypothetical protein
VADFVGQSARALPIITERGLDRSQVFPNLDHAAGAVIGVWERSCGIESHQAWLHPQPRMTLRKSKLPELCLLAGNHGAAVDTHYHSINS